VDASINVEVFSGASDRFGGKIAAVMYRPLVAESVPLVGERARTAMLRALPAQISYRAGACATGPSMHAAGGGSLPERRRKIVRGIRTGGVPSRLVRWRRVANGS
jgi:hypothetical protein